MIRRRSTPPPRPSRSPWPNRACGWAALFLAAWAMPVPVANIACAQDPAALWEFSPYQVRVWIAFYDAPQLTDRLYEQIARNVRWKADVLDFSSWRIAVSPVPQRWRSDVLTRFEQFQIPADLPDSDELLQGDKLFIARITVHNGNYLIETRGLDCHFRQWMPVVQKTTLDVAQLPHAVFAAMRQTFAPLTRIEHIAGKAAHVRVRAGGLVQNEESPSWIPKGAMMRPIVRRNDRSGSLRENGLEEVPLTLLMVGDRPRADLPWKVDCEIHSAMRGALNGRNSARIERVAMIARPGHPSTYVRVESDDRAPRALAGYLLYSRTPDEKEETELIGKTNLEGGFHVTPHATSPFRTIYIKSGARLLARLPIIPGFAKEITVNVPDDDHRLGAEAVVQGLENAAMDLIARRQVMAAEIRQFIEQKKFVEAEASLGILRKMDNRGDFIDKVDFAASRLTTSNARAQEKINNMFNGLRILLGSHLDPSLPMQLDSELKAARGS